MSIPSVGLVAGRRLTILAVTLALVAAPAVVARAFCLGRSCPQPVPVTAVPFCPLPADLRAAIAAGFRTGRSPDVLAVASAAPVVSRMSGSRVAWPSSITESMTVPIAVVGNGVTAGPMPAGTSLADLAPTLATLLGYAPPHPQVRIGRAIEGLRGSAPSPLAVEIAWKGVGSADLAGRWPARVAGFARSGRSTLEGRVGSLPIDPAAVLTTIGTGGIPAEHGITGTRLRGPDGRVARAWTPSAPEAVITTLPDELDRSFAGRSMVGLVATDRTDRGLIGDGWYLGADRDQVIVVPRDPVNAVRTMLGAGYGTDGVPDVLGVVLRGPVEVLDRRTIAIVRAVKDRVPRAVFAIAATGDPGAPIGATSGADVANEVDARLGLPAVASDAAGGVFLDTAALARAGRSADAVVVAMRAQTDPGGTLRFADVFPAFSVALARYC